MYKIAICDDDKDYILELEDMIKECNNNKRELEFIEFYSGEDLLKGIPEDSDVLFLDIQLKGADGNEIAVKLGEKGYQGLLVQCSGVFFPTPETIKISPYRYLLKQVDRETTCKDITEIFSEMDRQKACFTIEVSSNREKIIVRTADIVYITHHKKGSVVHLNKEKQRDDEDEKLITPYNFQELLEMLYPVGFVCPHNSYLINLRYVTSFSPYREFVELEGKMLPIARGKVEQFSKEFMDYINRKYKEKLK